MRHINSLRTTVVLSKAKSNARKCLELTEHVTLNPDRTHIQIRAGLAKKFGAVSHQHRVRSGL